MLWAKRNFMVRGGKPFDETKDFLYRTTNYRVSQYLKIPLKIFSPLRKDFINSAFCILHSAFCIVQFIGRRPLNSNLLFAFQMFLLLFYHKTFEKASVDSENDRETGQEGRKYLTKNHAPNRALFTKIRLRTNYLQSPAGNPLTT